MEGIRDRIDTEESSSPPAPAPPRLNFPAEEVTRAGLANRILGADDGGGFEEEELPPPPPLAAMVFTFALRPFGSPRSPTCNQSLVYILIYFDYNSLLIYFIIGEYFNLFRL